MGYLGLGFRAEGSLNPEPSGLDLGQYFRGLYNGVASGLWRGLGFRGYMRPRGIMENQRDRKIGYDRENRVMERFIYKENYTNVVVLDSWKLVIISAPTLELPKSIKTFLNPHHISRLLGTPPF